jgi:hypothetical protein
MRARPLALAWAIAAVALAALPAHRAASVSFTSASIPADYPFMVANANSGLCLDVGGGVFDAGTPIVQFACHGGTNQRWNFVFPASGPRYTGKIRSVGKPTLCIAKSSGSKLVLALCSAPPANTYVEWFVNLRTAGFYAHNISGVRSAGCIDVPNGSRENSTPLQTYDCHNGENQSWLLLPAR